jgi:hypothetical protein
VSNPLNNPLQKLEVNFVYLSETIVLGIPCNLAISFMKIYAILDVVCVFFKRKNEKPLLICQPPP